VGSRRYNQFVKQLMRGNKCDTEKLIELGGLIYRKYGVICYRERILLLDYEDNHLVKLADGITEEEFHHNIVHVPDITFYKGSELWIFEIDGWIHNVKSKVEDRDVARNFHYENAGIKFQVFNEWEILEGLGIKPDRSATTEEIFGEIVKRMDKIFN